MASIFQTLDNVYTIVRSLANKDSNTLTDATLLAFANKYYYLMLRELMGLNEEFYTNICVADLVANQTEYALPIDSTSTPFGSGFIKVLRVEVSHDGSNWYVAKPIDLTNQENSIIFSSVTGPTVATINQDYRSTSPKYAFFDKSVWLFPIPVSTDDVAASNANLRVFIVERPDELTASSSIPDLPKEWLAVLQEGMLYDVFRKFGRIADARDALNNWQIGLTRMRELEQVVNQEQRFNMKTVFKNYR